MLMIACLIYFHTISFIGCKWSDMFLGTLNNANNCLLAILSLACKWWDTDLGFCVMLMVYLICLHTPSLIECK